MMSDHGEELGESGLFNHRMSLSDAVVHVPLMVRLPGARGGGRHVAEQVALIDLLPTLLEAAGADAPTGIHGHSLWSGIQGDDMPERDFVFSEGTFRMVSAHRGRNQLVFSGVAADSPHVGDLLAHARLDGPAFGATPNASDAERVQIRDALTAWRASITKATGPGTPLSADQQAAMRDRGYWEVQ
jgi:arylsulfatase A-like enzyme